MIMPPPLLKTGIRYSYLHKPVFKPLFRVLACLLNMYILIYLFCVFHHQVTVTEHLPAGSAVITVTATDCDFGENGKITYRVMSSTRGGFYIDPSNGKVTVSTFMVVYNRFLTRAPLNYPS